MMDRKGTPNFRKLAEADATAMNALETQCFSLPWSREQCLGALRQDAFFAYGLWRGEELLAYISFYRHPDEMEILNFAVIPGERRRGYGDLILRCLLQTADNMGMQKVTLETRETNYPAIRLYEKRGFEISGVRRRYYPDTGENALIYCKNLKVSPDGERKSHEKNHSRKLENAQDSSRSGERGGSSRAGSQ